MRTEFFFTESPWLILPCILLGIIGAWLLYAKSDLFDKKIRLFLSIVRGFIISTLCFLLLGVLLRQIQTTKEVAKVVVLLDNSISMAPYGTEASIAAEQYGAFLQKSGYEVEYRLLDNEHILLTTDSISYNRKSTDLKSTLDAIRSDYESLHLTDVVLLSDGIINKGLSPIYSYYPFKVHTVAFGDTIPRIDAMIKNIATNQVVYMGNNFPIAVDLSVIGMKGKSTRLVVKQGEKVLQIKPIFVESDDFFITQSFELSAEKKGMQRYTIELEANDVEYSKRNNRKEVFVDVIDAQERILLLALAPHPDLKAIKSVMESSQNREVDIKIASTISDLRSLEKIPYDLVILHQLPSVDGVASDYLEFLKSTSTSLFIIVGNQSNNTKTSELLGGVVQLPKRSGQFDRVTGTYNNSSFQLFKLDNERLALIEKLPPLTVPFGDYQLRSVNDVLLYQKLGNLKMQKPLLLVGDNARRKVALLAGEGIWRWRMEEFSITSKHEIVDEILQKVVQYLSIKEDKRKFRVYPKSIEFELGEKIVLPVEIYNDLYELTYGQIVKVSMSKDGEVAKEYSYQHSREQPFFELSGLTEGAYQFTATTTINNKEEISKGQFRVVESDLELITTQADYNLLQTLSTNNQGVFGVGANWEESAKKLIEQKSPDKLKTKDDLVEVIEIRWLLLVLLFLLAIEWSSRKYNGQY